MASSDPIVPTPAPTVTSRVTFNLETDQEQIETASVASQICHVSAAPVLTSGDTEVSGAELAQGQAPAALATSAIPPSIRPDHSVSQRSGQRLIPSQGSTAESSNVMAVPTGNNTSTATQPSHAPIAAAPAGLNDQLPRLKVYATKR